MRAVSKHKLKSVSDRPVSVKSVTISKSSQPFAIAEDAERNSVTKLTRIQRPRPLNDYLTVPVLRSHSRKRPTKKVNPEERRAHDLSKPEDLVSEEERISDEGEAKIKDFG